MKRIFRFIVHNRRAIIKGLALATVAIIAYEVAHDFGTAERGYNAIGGEIFIPFLIVLAKPIWQMIKAPFKAVLNID